MLICTPLRCLVPAAVTLLLGACASQAPQQSPQASSTPAQRIAASANAYTCERPAYPADALAQKATGTVTIQFLISPDGYVVESKLVRSSGHPSLDQAAMSGLARCRFKPNMRDGRPVQAWTAVQYVWSMDK